MNDDLKNKLADLRQQRDQNLLSEEIYQLAVAGLQAKHQTQDQSGATAVGEGATAAGKRAVIVAGNVGGSIITGNVYYGQPTDDPVVALQIYRQVLIQGSRHIPLRGVGVEASDPTQEQKPMGLATVYVDLDTTKQIQLTQQEQTKRGLKARRDQKLWPLSALEAVASRRTLVLLGDPAGARAPLLPI